MAIYRNIHISFWQDEDMIELTPEQKYFYLYLMTNSKTNQSGCYKISNKVMQFETGYNKDTLSKLLKYFVDNGKIGYCEDTQEVIIYNWLKYNWSSSPKVISCIEKNIQDIENEEFRDWLINKINIQYKYTIDTVGIPNRNKNKNKQKNNNKEEIKEQEKDNGDKSPDDFEKLFDYFWSKYPRKDNKKKAHDQYIKILKKDKGMHSVMLAGLLRYVEWIRDGKIKSQFIKLPTTWINGECWNDELPKIERPETTEEFIARVNREHDERHKGE